MCTGRYQLLIYYLALALGIVCAGIGGELFLRGAVQIALWRRISPAIVGATIAAFATSSPELSVSVNSALNGTPEIALGDAVGSNVVNFALVLGITMLIGSIRTPKTGLSRDFPVALATPVLTALLAMDGTISRIDGAILITVFAAWLIATIIEVRGKQAGVEKKPVMQVYATVAAAVVGLAFLIGSGRLIVFGASEIAAAFGVSAFVIGAVVVAIGTSLPEMATAVISRVRGHDEVGLGTILGSNIFNALLIVPVAAMIHPIPVQMSKVSVALVAGMAAVAAAFPNRQGVIHRGRGLLLLAIYAAYAVMVIRGR